MIYHLWDSKNNINETFNSQDDAYDFLHKWVESSGFKSYYIRQNFITDTKIQIDYGSYTHFFYLEDLTEELDWNGT